MRIRRMDKVGALTRRKLQPEWICKLFGNSWLVNNQLIISNHEEARTRILNAGVLIISVNTEWKAEGLKTPFFYLIS